MTKQDMYEEMIDTLKALQPTIEDDYRATDDPDDMTPGLCVTFATDADADVLIWQSGDNSYSGACYGLPYWGVVYLYRDSDLCDLAEDAQSQILDQIEEDAIA